MAKRIEYFDGVKLVMCCLIMLALMLLGGCQAAPQEPAAGETTTIQILATSDVHGKFLPYDYALNEESASGSLAQVKTAVDSLRTDATLLIDCGDLLQGNSAELFLAEAVPPLVKAQNLIGYDVWVCGNHDFNYGLDFLQKAIAGQNAAVLCGNVYHADGSALAPGYQLFDVNGVCVCVIGMVTPNITRWDAENLKETTVIDPVAETRRIIDEVKNQADILIAAEHMDLNNEYELANSGVSDLAQACPELDLIIAAHGHKQLADTEINGVLIVENKDAAQTMAQVLFAMNKTASGTYEIAGKTAASLNMADYEPDAALTSELQEYHDKCLDDASQVIGVLSGGQLVPEDEIKGIPQVQLQETALVDLVNEVERYYSGADVAAMAVANLDANLYEGPIRKCDVSQIYKYTNSLYKLQMTGKQLKQYLEWAAGYYNTWQPGDLTISFNPDFRANTYDMFSGLNFAIDISQEPGSRVQQLTKADGTELADSDVLTVAVSDYRANTHLLTYGSVFQEGDELPRLLESDIHGEIGGIRELIADYIVNVKKGELQVPELTDCWRLTGYNWDEQEHQQIAELVNAGELTVQNSADGRTPNVKAFTQQDLR